MTVVEGIESFFAGCDAIDVNVSMFQKHADAELVRGVVFYDQKPAAAQGGVTLHL